MLQYTKEAKIKPLKMIAMSNTVPVNTDFIEQGVITKPDLQIIEAELLSKEMNVESISSLTTEYKRLKNSKRQFTGFCCMGLGAFLGFISCVLSILNPIPELYNLTLFGLTSVAILIVFYGLYCLFE